MNWSGITLLIASAAAHGQECPDGWLSVRGQVVQLMPASAAASKIDSADRESPVRVDGLLCSGDTLLVKPPLEYAEIRIGQRVERVMAGKRLTIPRGVGGASNKALDYVRVAMGAMSVFTPARPRPVGTFARGTGGQVPAGSPRPILYLDNAQPQHWTGDLPLIIAWNDGIAPYACESYESASARLTKADVGDHRWCEIGAPTPGRSARLLVVTDANQRDVDWRMVDAKWTEVPRPDWIAAGAGRPSSADELTAWGIWLWQRAGTGWRLQALAMLGAASRSEWFAGDFLDRALNEVPPVRPQ
ncbi:MAG TPA: hypothetical protein VF169_16630 [Albitalea sp.]|uniref:hypothetical protein n=1 Tax=Piscinibacter sp. TaxID=1903157 RepID=UPI002ED5217B